MPGLKTYKIRDTHNSSPKMRDTHKSSQYVVFGHFSYIEPEIFLQNVVVFA
jgi:hypothetical protein